MQLTQLHIHNFRNLENIELTPARGVNLIYGENASGKTSILEAIYYLSQLRSFRTNHITDLINRESNYLQLVAQITSDNNETTPVGIRRSRNKSEIRINKQPVKRVSEIAAKFPVLAIHPESYQLISGSPSNRRRYLDWGVFHVEHGFFQAWQRFNKSLQQRNAALRTKQKSEVCQLWNNEISKTAHYIDALRKKYMESLQPCISRFSREFFNIDELQIEYKRGWPDDKSLLELLNTNLAKERLKGYTYYGPHRADLLIKVNGQSAQTCISRGQQKSLVALMRLAQARNFTESTDKTCVLLYDDLAAELDINHRRKIISVLSEMNIQLFITAIERHQIDLSPWRVSRMFHVEHGGVDING